MGYLNAPLIAVISLAEKDFGKVPQAGSCQKCMQGSDMRFLWRRFQSTCCTVASAVKSFSIG